MGWERHGADSHVLFVPWMSDQALTPSWRARLARLVAWRRTRYRTQPAWVSPLSYEWLRQHERDSAKHGPAW